jgi:ABC-type amino acid transport substrate-binding protein
MKYFFYCFVIATFCCKASISAEHKLIVAVFLEPPYLTLLDDQLVGEHVDIINLLASAIKFQPVFIECPPVRCLAMVKQGKADMMIGLSKSLAREKHMIFLKPAYHVQKQPLYFYTSKDTAIRINSYNDLENLVIGTLRGAMYFSYFDNDNTLKKVEVTSRKQLVSMLLKGRIDTFLEREETVIPLLTAAQYQHKINVEKYQYNKPINSYIVISKQSKVKNYTEQLSQALAEAMADGTIDKIRTKSQNKDVTAPEQ